MRLLFRLVYSSEYFLPIGVHVFPAEKYRMIHDRLLATQQADEDDFIAPQPASDDDVRLVHGSDYVERLLQGELSRQEELQMELPYSPELVKAFWLAAGGSILAADRALADGVCINVGGGFHHAHPDHGEGFCMIHDVAVAIRRMQRDDKICTAMTVDCDVHHGNGTAAIFAGTKKTRANHYLRAARQLQNREPSCVELMRVMSSPSRYIRKIITRRGNRPHQST